MDADRSRPESVPSPGPRVSDIPLSECLLGLCTGRCRGVLPVSLLYVGTFHRFLHDTPVPVPSRAPDHVSSSTPT